MKLLKAEDGMDATKVRGTLFGSPFDTPLTLPSLPSLLPALQLDNESPYVIMFGPDSCGDTNKVCGVCIVQSLGIV